MGTSSRVGRGSDLTVGEVYTQASWRPAHLVLRSTDPSSNLSPGFMILPSARILCSTRRLLTPWKTAALHNDKEMWCDKYLLKISD